MFLLLVYSTHVCSNACWLHVNIGTCVCVCRSFLASYHFLHAPAMCSSYSSVCVLLLVFARRDLPTLHVNFKFATKNLLIKFFSMRKGARNKTDDANEGKTLATHHPVEEALCTEGWHQVNSKRYSPMVSSAFS